MMQQANPIHERVSQILQSVDELLRRLNNWIGDPHASPVLPDEVGVAIRQAELVCAEGDIPQKCKELVTMTMPRVAAEFTAYEKKEFGKYQPDGQPGPMFWAAVKELQKSRMGAEPPVLSKRESVAALRRQKVSDMQIASSIYGFRGEGPFMLPDGTPDLDLLDKEEKEPGSVVKADWVPPWEQDAYDRRKKELANKLSVYDRLQNGGGYEDPDTIEELLRQGAFVQQIERAKNVTRARVLAVAKKIGVTPVDQPGYAPTYDEIVEEPDDDEPTDEALDVDAIREQAIEMFVKSEQKMSAPEIAQELTKKGYNTNARSISAFLGAWKRASRKTTTAE